MRDQFNFSLILKLREHLRQIIAVMIDTFSINIIIFIELLV